MTFPLEPGDTGEPIQPANPSDAIQSLVSSASATAKAQREVERWKKSHAIETARLREACERNVQMAEEYGARLHDAIQREKAAEAERDALRAKVARVEELHIRASDEAGDWDPWCEGCGHTWPCTTIAALSEPAPTPEAECPLCAGDPSLPATVAGVGCHMAHPTPEPASGATGDEEGS